MRLRQVKSVVEYGHWAKNKGFIVGEGPFPYGPISPVHSTTSLHYSDRALDINYRAGTGTRWNSEKEALTWLYKKTLNFRTFHRKWPLDEMFFNNLGFIKELGVFTNYPIANHEDHLHIGFIKEYW